jgi:hypothetical protein
MTKDEMIEALITDDLNDWFNPKEKDAYFAMHLRDGFIGYLNKSEEELMEECLDRILIKVEEKLCQR